MSAMEGCSFELAHYSKVEKRFKEKRGLKRIHCHGLEVVLEAILSCAGRWAENLCEEIQK